MGLSSTVMASGPQPLPPTDGGWQAGSERMCCPGDPGRGRLIACFELHHLALPVRSRRDHGIGSIRDRVEVVVLCLRDTDGAAGYGEAACWPAFTGSPEAALAALGRYICPWLPGCDPAAVGAIMTRARAAVVHCPEAMAALETALLDLVARRAGLPLWALLGGACRTTIPLSCSLANPDFTEDRALLERLVDDGVGIVKLKAGFRDHRFDLRRLEALRSDWPELDVRVDYNQALAPHEAMARVRDVAAFAPTFIEQPVAAHHFGLMARLRGEIGVPLLADESVFGPGDMLRAIDTGCCDGVSVKVMKAGGPLRARCVADMAAAAGLSAYGGDMFESGLGHLAGVHVVAASPAVTLGCEFYQAHYYLNEDILHRPFPLRGGEVVVPDTPGLGDEPDPEKLRRYSRERGRPCPVSLPAQERDQ